MQRVTSRWSRIRVSSQIPTPATGPCWPPLVHRAPRDHQDPPEPRVQRAHQAPPDQRALPGRLVRPAQPDLRDHAAIPDQPVPVARTAHRGRPEPPALQELRAFRAREVLLDRRDLRDRHPSADSSIWSTPAAPSWAPMSASSCSTSTAWSWPCRTRSITPDSCLTTPVCLFSTTSQQTARDRATFLLAPSPHRYGFSEPQVITQRPLAHNPSHPHTSNFKLGPTSPNQDNACRYPRPSRL